MSLTKEQWAQVERAITGVYGSVTFKADGHQVTWDVLRDKQKLVIGIYVDGFVKGKWFIDEPSTLPEHKFYPLRTKNKWSARHIKSMEKIFGKRRAKKEGYYDKRQFHDLCHNTPKAAIAHMKKAATDIQLLKINGVEV